MSEALRTHINKLIEQGAEIQVGLRGSPQPLGPAKVEHVEHAGSATGLYRMLVPAQMQANKHSKPNNVLLPLIFALDDVMLLIEAPITQDGSPIAIVNPNGRTPGGLHIPGS